MPNKIVIFLKRIIKLWFIILILAILIIYLYYPTPAIWITVISIIIIALSFIPGLYLKLRLIKFMKEYYRIDDKTIAKYFGKPLRKIQNKMFVLSQKQEGNSWLYRLLRRIYEPSLKLGKKKWLIIFYNKQYIFYHMETIEKIKSLYEKGYSDKEMLEDLKEFEIKSRDEIKAIIETLIKYKTLSEREISVKERREKKRFENL
ncbi:MAG: hypothetical protein ACFFHV_08320 [Promethearchaeota archaeon]